MNKLEHTVLGRLWEILLTVHLTDRLTHKRVHEVCSTLPHWIVLLLSAECLTESELNLTEIG